MGGPVDRSPHRGGCIRSITTRTGKVVSRQVNICAILPSALLRVYNIVVVEEQRRVLASYQTGHAGDSGGCRG